MPFADFKQQDEAPPFLVGTDPFFQAKAPAPTGAETARAAFRQENDIFNFMELVTRPNYAPEEGFDAGAAARKQFPQEIKRGEVDFLARARSQAEFDSLVQRKQKEETDRQTLQAAGGTGIAWAIAAGVISPTTFIPLVGVTARGGKALAQGAALVGGAVAAQEAVLHTNQLTRTGEETAIAVGAGVILGGILGGAVGAARNVKAFRAQQKTLAKFADDVDPDTPDQLVDISVPGVGQKNSVGAAMAQVAPDGTAGILDTSVGFGALEKFGPVTRTLNNGLSSARRSMAQISDAGLRLTGKEGTKVFAPGGTIENRVAFWRGGMTNALRDLDSSYARYVFEEEPAPLFLPTTRASLTARKSGKMGLSDFYKEVSRAMRADGQGDFHPEVLKARDSMNKNVYEPLLQAGKEAGVFPDDVKTVGDLGYLNRIYNIEAIKADENGFLDILTDHYEGVLREEFSKKAASAASRVEETQTLRADLDLSDADAEKLTADIERQLSEGDEGTKTKEALDDLKNQVDAAETESEASELLDQIKELRTQKKDVLRNSSRKNARLNRRLRNLNKTISQLEQSRSLKMGRIETLEAQQGKALDTLINKAAKLEADAARLTDKELFSRIRALKGAFKNAVKRSTKAETELQEIYAATNGDMTKLLGPTGVALNQWDKLVKIGEDLTLARDVVDNRPLLGQMLNNTLQEAKERTLFLNAKKVARRQRLEADIDALDPKRAIAAADAKVSKAKERVAKVEEDFRQRGLEDIDVAEGTANFKPASRELAELTSAKIKGQNGMRLVGPDIIRELRGPEMKRMLQIDSALIENYLENNVEKLVRAYVRTMSPDIELAKRFGSVNAASIEKAIDDEFSALLEAGKSGEKKQALIEETTTKIREAKRDGNAAEIPALEDRLLALKKETTTGELNAWRDAAKADIGAVIGRLRHTWGIPADPSGFAARGVRIMQNINTLRFMGMVAVSSIPDIARGIQKYGPGRFYRSGLKPLVTNFKSLKMNLQEAQMAGTALDVFLHTRMHEMMEMVDDFGKRSKFEEGLEYATSKIGVLGLFDYWNTWIKGFGSMLYNAEALDAIATLAKEGHKGAKTAKQAEQFLATLQIDGESARDIWRLVEAGGGGEVKPGVWMPETDGWVEAAKKLGTRKVRRTQKTPDGKPKLDKDGKIMKARKKEGGEEDSGNFFEEPVFPEERVNELLRVYRAALVREVDSLVVTPGLERPLFTDGSLTGKVLSQFRSFAFSSTFKTLMAGMQERNANFMIGSAAALGFGALSYKTWGVLAGHDVGDDDYDKWLDEAVDRSGLLGIFGEVRNVGSTIPWMNDYVMFSGQQTVRRGGTGIADALFGPTGDLVNTASRLLSGLDDPTVGTARMGRKLIPFQNLWWARQAIFDNAVAGLDLPERRQ